MTILLGLLIVTALSALTGYFVAQEFGYMAVDRSRLDARAAEGDSASRRAREITKRTSFMLSGAQLGITVTGLLVGYVAEPMIGDGVGALLGGVGIPRSVGIAIGILLALLFSTVVQMVVGELVPKNLAIARPEPVARWLAFSTSLYLTVFGWLIRLFDEAASLLLRMVRVQPVHDVEHAATPKDLEHIVAESRQSGELSAELSTLLDRGLDFSERSARHAMTPRPLLTTVSAKTSLPDLIRLISTGVSTLPVIGSGVDDIIGVVSLRDVLSLGERPPRAIQARDIARRPLLVPESSRLPKVLTSMRAADEEFACVVDEYGGLAGVITREDIAEELVGEFVAAYPDRPGGSAGATGAVGAASAGGPDGPGTAGPLVDEDWVLPGSVHIDEVERLIGRDLPDGSYETVGGLIMATLGRLPETGDQVTVQLPAPPDQEAPLLSLRVEAVDRRVPAQVRLRLALEPLFSEPLSSDQAPRHDVTRPSDQVPQADQVPQGAP